MLAGNLYMANDPLLLAKRAHATKLCTKFNNLDCEPDQPEKQQVLEELFGSMGDEVCILSPFRCDYVGSLVKTVWGICLPLASIYQGQEHPYWEQSLYELWRCHPGYMSRKDW